MDFGAQRVQWPHAASDHPTRLCHQLPPPAGVLNMSLQIVHRVDMTALQERIAIEYARLHMRCNGLALPVLHQVQASLSDPTISCQQAGQRLGQHVSTWVE